MKIDFYVFITALLPMVIWLAAIVIKWFFAIRAIKREAPRQLEDYAAIELIYHETSIRKEIKEHEDHVQLLAKFEHTPPQAHSWMYETDTKQLFDRR